MTLISQSFPSLIGGVSQQAPSQRLPNQLELQENCLNSITQGMRKRPNTILLTELDVADGEVLSDTYIHQIKRDRYEQYVVTIKPSGINVYDRTTGYKYPVVYSYEDYESDPIEYLTLSGESDSVRTAYSALTSADTTYVLNTTKAVLRTSGITETVDGYGRESITIGYFNYAEPWLSYFISGTYKFSDGDTVFLEESDDLSPSEIAQKVVTYFQGLDAYSDYTFTVVDNVIYVDYPTDSGKIPLEDYSYTESYTTLTLTGTTGDKVSEDYSIITRSDVSSSVSATTTNNVALCHVKQADYSVAYTISINGTEYVYSTPETDDDEAEEGISLTSVMENLVAKINETATDVFAEMGLGYFTVTPIDEDTELSISAYDDLNGESFIAAYQSIQLFSDLPSRAPDEYVIKVLGSVEDEEDEGYWVKFVQTGDLGQGYWEESRTPSEMHMLDATTMPHVLVRSSSTDYVDDDNPSGIYFEFKAGEWDEREIGDDDVTPFPSFCSEWDDDTGTYTTLCYINAMTFHKNRLVFTSDENIVFSESGNYWNFFRTTAQSVIDSDPIDINILSKLVNPIKAMVSAQKELILFGTRLQYTLKSGDTFSASTVWAEAISSYDVDLSSDPQYVGNSVYFVVNRESYNGIFESIVNDDSQHEATEATAHVPEYVEGTIRKLATSSSEDIIIAIPDTVQGAGSTLYQYSFKVQGNEKVQSAWNKWTFTQDVLDIEIEGSVAYFVTHKGGKYYTEIMYLSQDELREELGVPVFLDQRQEVDADYELPDGMEELTYKDRRFIGYPYTQKAQLTQLYLRDSNNQSIQTGRLQLRRLTLNFDETTAFDVEIAQEARETRTVNYEGRVLGSITQQIGVIPVDNGSLKVPLLGRSKGMEITIINDTPFDCRIQSGEWEGMYHNRARRS